MVRSFWWNYRWLCGSDNFIYHQGLLTMEKEVIAVIDKIRPYIQRDGGDIEFVSVDDQGVVKVRMLGACVGCGLIDITLKDGLEALLLDEVPGVTEVVLDLEEDLF